MNDEPLNATDLEARFAAMTPSSIPDETFQSARRALSAVVSWRRSATAALIGGLLTEVAFANNGIRLDWLLRLVLSKSEGRKKPGPAELRKVLNEGMSAANITQLEDPAEDLFCELIVTPRGGFRIFLGQWESAAAYTQTMIGAFEALPDAPPKQAALDHCYALLKISDALASRADAAAGILGGGSPQSTIELPAHDRLWRLAKRVEFSWRELTDLGIEAAAVTRFLLAPALFSRVGGYEVGDTPLEFRPLLATQNGIAVIAPSNISLAIRALLIDVALGHGMGRTYQRHVMEEQERYATTTSFWPLNRLELSVPNRLGMRASVCEYEPGRYLQVLQIFGSFDGFPQRAFGSMREFGKEASRFIAEDIERFWTFCGARDDCRSMATVLLFGGWGSPVSLLPPLNEAKVPANWDYLMFSFADCAVFGVCDDSKFKDLLRIKQQERRLKQEGFDFMNQNGIMNLFGFWRETDGNLIPEHLIEVKPPTLIGMPTDSLLKPRAEAAQRRGFRALPHPLDGMKAVQRLGWGTDEETRDLFASIGDLSNGKLSGVVVESGRRWWIDSVATAGEDRDWRYRLWNAILQWLDALAAPLIARFPDNFPPGAAAVSFVIPSDGVSRRIDPLGSISSNLQDTLARTSDCGYHSVEILPGWFGHLQVPENDAEVELLASILVLISLSGGSIIEIDVLKAAIVDIVGSQDWRQLHAREAASVQDYMSANGLVGSFSPIPFSAHSLVKCGFVWTFRDRLEGNAIDGEEACGAFLQTYGRVALERLVAEIRRFNRAALAKAVVRDYQASRAEHSRWHSTIKALRAISGARADRQAFDHQNKINGVQRAAKIVAELAACEAPESGGLEPGGVDLDELYALALMVFGNGQLFASIKAGLIAPELRISPAGDLLSARGSSARLLQPGAEWMQRRMLDDSASRYGQSPRDGPPNDGKLHWEEGLLAAIRAEYGASAEALIELQFAVLRWAESRGEGAFVVRRSELAATLAADEAFPDEDVSALLQRLTLPHRSNWLTVPSGLRSSDFDISKFDRPFSLINRPLLNLDGSDDPAVLVSPLLVSDAVLYCLQGLIEGTLNNTFWVSSEARRYAGVQGSAAGGEFEDRLANKLRSVGLTVYPRCKLSTVLNQKVPPELGDVDALAVTADGNRVWAIEAKDLRLCRTEMEGAARMSEYRGRIHTDLRGKSAPDKMLRHLRRVQYLRDHRDRLAARLKLPGAPEVSGLLIVNSPQPMNFYSGEVDQDGKSTYLDAIDGFEF